MKNRLKRLYQMSDADMLQHSQLVTGFFETDLALFTDLVTDMDTAYLANLKAQLSSSEAEVSDHVIKDEMAQLTEQVNIKVEECIALYQKLRFFIKRAFKKKTIQNSLGINEFSDKRKLHGSMIFFMRDLTDNIEKYRTEIAAAGCNPMPFS